MLRSKLPTIILAITLLSGMELVVMVKGSLYWPKHKTEVIISNHLESKANLQIHCKDKKTDFGVHQVAYNSTYTFDFKASVFGRTLYFCGFRWENQFHMFDIYVEERDFDTCGFHCRWEVWQSGPCIHKPKKFEYTRCYPWNPPKQLSP